jgi:hypothetical protein
MAAIDEASTASTRPRAVDDTESTATATEYSRFDDAGGQINADDDDEEDDGKEKNAGDDVEAFAFGDMTALSILLAITVECGIAAGGLRRAYLFK